MQNHRKTILITAAVIAAAVIAAVLFFLLFDGRDVPSRLTATVAWNPHSTSDDMMRALAPGMETQLALQNMPGANGARGLNAVYAAARDGENILATSLSPFVTAEAMGFAESPRQNWTGWLCAFSPAIIAVAADSPLTAVDDLTGVLRGANSGIGTISFAAAELFRAKAAFEFEHISHAGSSPAINALINGDADFAVMLSTEIAAHLRSGELRALAAFTETYFTLYSDDDKITIPPIIGITASLDALLPFGEYHGIFIPADTPQNTLNGIERLLQTAAQSEVFITFANERGIVPLTPNRTLNAPTIENFSDLVNQTLYNAGFLPALPQRP